MLRKLVNDDTKADNAWEELNQLIDELYEAKQKNKAEESKAKHSDLCLVTRHPILNQNGK